MLINKKTKEKEFSIDYISIDPKKGIKIFLSHLDLSKNQADNFIKEDISGDILLDLNVKDYKALEIKKGKKKRIQIYLEENKEKFKTKPLKLIIGINANHSEVKKFFEEYLYFKGNINNIDEKELLNLSEEKMKNIGLNLGQRKKLIKYINYVKSLKNEMNIIKKVLKKNLICF